MKKISIARIDDEKTIRSLYESYLQKWADNSIVQLLEVDEKRLKSVIEISGLSNKIESLKDGLNTPISKEIYQKLSDIIKDRTAIFISHRLSSCKFADEIVVFDRGSIIEKGSHKDLLEKDTKYAQLWKAQSEYYI